MCRLQVAVIVFVISACPGVETSCRAEDTSSDVSVESVLKGMKTERAKLVRGSVAISGVKSSWDYKFGAHITKVEMFCAFDHETGHLRFDRTESHWTISGPRDNADVFQLPPEIRQSRLWRTESETAHLRIQHPGDKPYLELHPPDYLPNFPGEAPFDIRAVGLLYWPSFRHNGQYDEVLDVFMSQTPAEATEQRAGQYLLTWVIDYRQKRTLWVDTDRGFTPTKMTIQTTSTPMSPNWDANLSTVNEVSWQEVDGVWVPATFMIGLRYRSGGECSTSYHLIFDWKSVNQPLPENLFDYKERQLEE